MLSINGLPTMENGARRSTPRHDILSPLATVVRSALRGTVGKPVDGARSVLMKLCEEPESTSSQRRTNPTRTISCKAARGACVVSSVGGCQQGHPQVAGFFGVLGVVVFHIQKEEFHARTIMVADIPFVAVEVEAKMAAFIDLGRCQAAYCAVGYHRGVIERRLRQRLPWRC